MTIMKKYLEDYCIPHTAPDATEALNLIRKFSYSAFIIDIRLGGEMDGIELVKIIREMGVYRNIPIIAVTAYFRPKDVKSLISAGFDDVIIKPFKKEILIEKLRDRIVL